MKIEEAIETLEEKRKYCKMFYELSANPQEDYPSTAKFMNALELALTALRSMQEAVEPLSLDQLREMDGKPVWIEDTNCWGLVFIPKAGQFKNSPFVLFRKEGVQFEWHVTDSELTIYSYPPAHIDRSEWEACELCSLPDGKSASRLILAETCNGEAKYCPSCGRPLTEEAWAELERRLMG